MGMCYTIYIFAVIINNSVMWGIEGRYACQQSDFYITRLFLISAARFCRSAGCLSYQRIDFHISRQSYCIDQIHTKAIDLQSGKPQNEVDILNITTLNTSPVAKLGKLAYFRDLLDLPWKIIISTSGKIIMCW